MNEEIDEGEFYHQDFTTASEWEIFIARMEEIIHEWKIQDTKNDTAATVTNVNSWNIRQEKLHFADVEFMFTEYKNISNDDEELIDDGNEGKKVINLFNSKYDFQPYNGKDVGPEYSVEYWYGLQHFMILSNAHNTSINNESQIKMLLSSVNIVISNSGCEVPIFIQIREKWQRCYQGIYETDGVRINFEMVHLRRGPQHCKYLTGLLDLFKTKIASPLPLEPVTVSVQLSYYLNNWYNSTWFQESEEIDVHNLDITSLSKLRFGVTFDPVIELFLNATWLELPEHLVVDSENYSDFDPLQAPKWTAEVTMAESPVCLLSECLAEFLSLYYISSNLEEILGDLVSSTTDSANPLDLLTESRIPTISSVIKRAAGHTKLKISKANAPIPDDTLVKILYYLFPDAEEQSKTPYKSSHKEIHSENSFANENEIGSDIENMGRGIKSCQVDSLVWRLSIVLAQAMISLGGVKTVSYIWYEFVQEMRYRWEKSIAIFGISSGFPDHRTCLLHQKLQMLNCCIERKKNRETAVFSAASSSSLDTSSEDDDDDSDEFYDCDADEDGNKRIKHSLWNKPVGRLSKHGNLRLLKSGEQLYIPVTQEPVPKTEDQLEEDTDVLLKLGTDAQGSELRARMMSASLLSDMESFKAANPDAILEDFIRWYSPRDWVEEDGFDQWGQKTGRLSSRMLIADNTWVQTWDSAKPVPSNRQKRLFDDTREAEKVLHFLESRSPALIASLLLPVLIHAAIIRLSLDCNEASNAVPETIIALRHIVKNVERASREPRVAIHKYEIIVQELSTQELLLSQINSLLYKFNPSGSRNERVDEFVSSLVTGREVPIEGGAQSFIGSRLIHMFSEAQRAAKMITDPSGSSEPLPPNLQTQRAVFPQANKREFVMRVNAVRPAPYSATTAQMLRAIFSKNEFRLAGAFSEDITFN